MSDSIQAISGLLDAAAVRSRSLELFALAEQGVLPHFRYVPSRLAPTVDYVMAVINDLYPNGDIPYHSRLRHFNAGGVDRTLMLNTRLDGSDASDRLKAWCELVIVSVLMDAGAGPKWHYKEAESDHGIGRSEGLAVASFGLYYSGWFADDPSRAPLRVDGKRLESISVLELQKALQVSEANPLLGCEGRAALLRSLGKVVTSNNSVFGAKEPRLGNFATWLVEQTKQGGSIPAAAVLSETLRVFGSIWPGRITIAGTNLGDTWSHSLVGGSGATRGLVPFHKLSQWLSYSLIEVLEQAGHPVSQLDALTGLPEYRNGGLILDLGLIELKDPKAAEVAHDPGSELIIEWRALTVVLLDKIAACLREKLGLSASEFPLAKALEGGTWHAGRRIAKEKRADGGPPLTVRSDGTVF